MTTLLYLILHFAGRPPVSPGTLQFFVIRYPYFFALERVEIVFGTNLLSELSDPDIVSVLRPTSSSWLHRGVSIDRLPSRFVRKEGVLVSKKPFIGSTANPRFGHQLRFLPSLSFGV